MITIRTARLLSERSYSLIDAYLVEARSWGGQSGSPAFVYFPADRHHGFLTFGDSTQTDEQGNPIPHPTPLLEMVQGHLDIEQDIAFTGEIATEGRGEVRLNAGIAVVVSAQKISELLMEDELVQDREKLKADVEQTQSTSSPDMVAEDQGQFERFEDLTRKLVNTPQGGA